MKLKSSIVAACVVGLALGISSGASAQFDPTKKVQRGPGGPPKVFTPARPGGPQVHHGHKNRSHTGRNVAAGVAAGVIGAIILNEAAKASSSSSSYESDGLSCRQLERRCDDGKDWACRKYDRRGC